MAGTSNWTNIKVNDPIRNAFEVTPTDGADLTEFARAFMVGVSGDVRVDTLNGDTVTLTGVAAGIPIPIMVKRIYSTGTTATDIVALY